MNQFHGIFLFDNIIFQKSKKVTPPYILEKQISFAMLKQHILHKVISKLYSMVGTFIINR